MTAPVADYSYLSAIANCGRYAYYAFERGLVPRDTAPSVALHLGRAIHVAIDWLYTNDWDVDGAVAAALDTWGDFALPPTHKHAYATRGHLEVIVRNYADDRKDDAIRPMRLHINDINIERLGIDLSQEDGGYIRLIETPLVVKMEDLTYAGKIDLPAYAGDELAIIDTKTSRQWLSEHWAQRYARSHQLRGYVLMMRELTGLDFHRAYINAIYTGKEAADEDSKWAKRSTKRNAIFGPFVYSKQMLEETKQWARQWLKMRDIYREQATAIGETAWPQNDRACFMYGEPCVFYDICKQSPHIREAIIRTNYERRELTGVLASGADSED